MANLSIPNRQAMYLLRIYSITNCVYIFVNINDLFKYVKNNNIKEFNVENVYIDLDNVKEIYNEIHKN